METEKAKGIEVQFWNQKQQDFLMDWMQGVTGSRISFLFEQ